MVEEKLKQFYCRKMEKFSNRLFRF